MKSITRPLELNELQEFDLENGSSLGLRVANGLIEEMGGHFLIKSEIGKGLSLMCAFP